MDGRFEAKKKLYQSMEQHLDEALDKVKSLAKEPIEFEGHHLIGVSLFYLYYLFIT